MALSIKSEQVGNALPKTPWKLIFLALVFLFNPNINVIDILPDCIGYFIIAKLLTYPADISPYFEEARSTFLKLAWLNLLKIPSILVVVGSGVGRGDTTALLSFGFAVGDAILGIMAVKYLFDALFYLGERTEATSLIEPFGISRRHTTTPEAFRSLTILFLCIKCAISTLPEFLLLTEDTIGGGYTAVNLAMYPLTVVLSQLLGWCLGIIWLHRGIRYAKALLSENGFDVAFGQLFNGDFDMHFERKFRLRSILATFSIMIFASFMAFVIRFDNLGGGTLIPACFFPLVFTYAIFVSRNQFKNSKGLFILGLLSSVMGLGEAVLSHLFFGKHTLEDIYYFDTAKALYLPLEVVSVITSALTIAFLVLCAKNLHAFILENTGISPESEGYRSVDRDYHKLLWRRAKLFFGCGILLYIVRAVDVVLYGMPKIIFTNPSDVTMPVVVTSALPWFSAFVCGVSVAFILLSFYFFSTMKDEVKIKFEIA
ncbi:MAG: hypothetical protein IKC72_03250 [Clostridia bacterium]|nr:hypothetical protein [Clostridia bacterium]